MTDKINARADVLFGIGLKFNGQEYSLDDINVHWTEITCDTDEVFNAKVDKIKAEIQIQSPFLQSAAV